MKIINSLIIGGLGVFSVIFLLNPGAGFFFEIPDNIPIIGNLDEAAAAALLISCLAYFGFDVTRIFKKAEENNDQKKAAGKDPKEVIDIETVEH
ncbi:MAG: DUF1232 domain-containing protein [Verrucomicrobia bacterium]|nr:DUF1232 domain-containing protein [Verrucomicrobiota bacterium]